MPEPAEEFHACLDWPALQYADPPATTPPPYAPTTLPAASVHLRYFGYRPRPFAEISGTSPAGQSWP